MEVSINAPFEIWLRVSEFLSVWVFRCRNFVVIHVGIVIWFIPTDIFFEDVAGQPAMHPGTVLSNLGKDTENDGVEAYINWCRLSQLSPGTPEVYTLVVAKKIQGGQLSLAGLFVGT